MIFGKDSSGLNAEAENYGDEPKHVSSVGLRG
jgi:hypothetical protein